MWGDRREWISVGKGAVRCGNVCVRARLVSGDCDRRCPRWVQAQRMPKRRDIRRRGGRRSCAEGCAGAADGWCTDYGCTSTCAWTCNVGDMSQVRGCK